MTTGAPVTSGDSYLVTGGMGCLGAWVLKHLTEAGRKAVSFDVSDDRRRLDLIMPREDQEAIEFVRGDLSESDAVRAAIESSGVTRIIHLAALQIPFCRSDPVKGAQVNVVGFMNVLEAARHAGIEHLAYASSAAVYGPAERYPQPVLPTDAPLDPATIYGAYKVANESCARVYAADHGIGSIGLRPYTVYGVGRDQGVTSEPTAAMLEAARGEDSTISFRGRMQFHFASDVAHAFIRAADAEGVTGAHAFNLGSEPVSVEEAARLIEELRPGVKVTVEEGRLPFPEGMESGRLDEILPGLQRTPIREGVRLTLDAFEACLADGRLAPGKA